MFASLSGKPASKPTTPIPASPKPLRPRQLLAEQRTPSTRFGSVGSATAKRSFGQDLKRSLSAQISPKAKKEREESALKGEIQGLDEFELVESVEETLKGRSSTRAPLLPHPKTSASFKTSPKKKLASTTTTADHPPSIACGTLRTPLHIPSRLTPTPTQSSSTISRERPQTASSIPQFSSKPLSKPSLASSTSTSTLIASHSRRPSLTGTPAVTVKKAHRTTASTSSIPSPVHAQVQPASGIPRLGIAPRTRTSSQLTKDASVATSLLRARTISTASTLSTRIPAVKQLDEAAGTPARGSARISAKNGAKSVSPLPKESSESPILEVEEGLQKGKGGMMKRETLGPLRSAFGINRAPTRGGKRIDSFVMVDEEDAEDDAGLPPSRSQLSYTSPSISNLRSSQYSSASPLSRPRIQPRSSLASFSATALHPSNEMLTEHDLDFPSLGDTPGRDSIGSFDFRCSGGDRRSGLMPPPSPSPLSHSGSSLSHEREREERKVLSAQLAEALISQSTTQSQLESALSEADSLRLEVQAARIAMAEDRIAKDAAEARLEVFEREMEERVGEARTIDFSELERAQDDYTALQLELETVQSLLSVAESRASESDALEKLALDADPAIREKAARNKERQAERWTVLRRKMEEELRELEKEGLVDVLKGQAKMVRILVEKV